MDESLGLPHIYDPAKCAIDVKAYFSSKGHIGNKKTT